MSHKIITKPDHGTPIAVMDGKELEINSAWRTYFDDIEDTLNRILLGDQITLEDYTVATLPTVTSDHGWIDVTDASGGAIPAFSDGTDWRRSDTRAVIT